MRVHSRYRSPFYLEAIVSTVKLFRQLLINALNRLIHVWRLRPKEVTLDVSQKAKLMLKETGHQIEGRAV